MRGLLHCDHGRDRGRRRSRDRQQRAPHDQDHDHRDDHDHGYVHDSLCRLFLLAVLAATTLSCAHGPSLFHKGPARIEYTLRVAAALTAIEVRACFVGAAPRELVSGAGNAADYVTRAWLDTPRGPRTLALRNQRIALTGDSSNACVHYLIAAHPGGGLAYHEELERIETALVADTALLLWHPPDWQRYQLSARIIVPAGMDVSVPWPRSADGYVLDASTLAFQAIAVFGLFDHEQIAVPGGELEIALLPGLPAETRSYVMPWLETAARTAALATGSFPREHAQAVVIPSAPSQQPVRFGSTKRGGGASIVLLLPMNAELEPLRHDWVAVHEFCHLLHPFVDRDDAWLSEGLATYYQEVLRVRAGLESEHEAWQRLFEGASLGLDEAGGLAQASKRMFQNFSFRRVYWAGAAFAFMLDVELRRAGPGRLSLDRVMRELAKRAVAQPRAWRASEVVAEIDRISRTKLASGLMARYVAAGSFPDVRPLYRELGLMSGDAPLATPEATKSAWLRDAIMHPAAAHAPSPPADAGVLAGARD